MTTLIGVHEVKDSAHWANAWKKGDKNRHEMFANAGVVGSRTFKDPKNPNFVGVLFDIEDMEKFQKFMESDQAKQSMAEDGLKVETLKILAEF